MTQRFSYVFWGSVSLAVGVLFYVFVRGYLVSPAIIFSVNKTYTAGILAGSFPSFIHSFAFVLAARGLGFGRSPTSRMVFLLGIFLEILQPIFSLGTFDIIDLLAVMVGVCLGDMVSSTLKQRINSSLTMMPLLCTGLFTGMASFPIIPPETSEPPRKCYSERGMASSLRFSNYRKPVYMTYQDVRLAFAVEEARPLKSAGKILTLGTHLLISEPNVGVHVFDNSDPSNPLPTHFLNIPGNVDLAAKKGVVYADSYVDLLALRIDGEKPELIKRITETFPWSPYQAITDHGIRFKGEDIDRIRGVIVGAVEIEATSTARERMSPSRQTCW